MQMDGEGAGSGVEFDPELAELSKIFEQSRGTGLAGKPVTGEATTQTERVRTTSTATNTPPAPPKRTYAAAAVQTQPVQRRQAQQAAPQQSLARYDTDQETSPTRHGTTQATPQAQRHEQQAKRGQGRERGRPSGRPNLERPPITRALVMHAAPLKYKPGTMRRWIEEDNRGIKILGIRWLLRGDRRGQVASSLVIYMQDPIEATKLRMGRRLFRTTCYDWDR